MTGQTHRRRYVYAISYLLMALAGIAAVAYPAPSVKSVTATIDLFLYVWDAFLIIGGLCSCFGAVTDRWIGEYLGLPLLSSVFAVYGIAALYIGGSSRPTSLAGGCALLSIAMLIIGRWREVSVVRKSAVDGSAPGGGY